RDIAALRDQHVPEWKLADVEIFHKAGVWALAHNEWYKGYAKYAVQTLDHGLERAEQLKSGDAPWLNKQGAVFRGYRSALDGSVQPYEVVLPASYPDAQKLWRLDLVLHGRDDTLTETKFLHAGDSTGPAPEQDYIELRVYGRGNNAYRWAGETDVFEALAAFRAAEQAARGRDPIDPNRIVLRGFSMGGAGAWHLGLTYPSFWCSVSPGAGFTTTFGREKNPGGKLPDYVVKCLGMYDALDYAENVFDVPVVAYGGEIDPQREASESIKDKITPMGLHATFLVGPKMGHKYDPESLKTIMQLQGEHAAAGRPAYPPHVRYVTMTVRYPDCFWASVLRQQHQYDRSLVDAERRDNGWEVKCENVQTLRLVLPPEWQSRKQVAIDIDGRTMQAKVDPRRDSVLLDRQTAGWSQVDDVTGWEVSASLGQWKTPGLTGPIDDAFTSPFLCVRGTGKPWNAEVQHHADLELQRFAREWNKWFRGELPVKNDADVTPEELQHKNLILFGDPSSNSLIARVLARLPIQWTAETLTVAGKPYPAASTIPALVYPNPLAPNRYVVLNSGHTFHEADFKASNRMLYPRFGDFAVLQIAPDEKDPASARVVTAGLFDETWHWPTSAAR
ncbi:MAG TPA: hypothetical protein VGI81_22240, partial [Tepidisphaeraceae bacterium]